MQKLNLVSSLILIFFIFLLASCGDRNPMVPDKEISGGVIKGNVVDIVGEGKVKVAGLKDIKVCIEGKNLCDLTDDKGYFEILNVPPGMHTIIAYVGNNRAAFANVNLKKDEVKNIGEIRPVNCGQVAGLVSDAKKLKPLEGVKITLQLSNYSTTPGLKGDNNIPLLLIAITDKSGRYSILAPSGIYLLSATKEGYIQDFRDIVVSELATTPCDIQLHPKEENTGEVKGKVSAKLSDGAIVSVPYAVVTLVEQECSSFEDCAYYYSITDWEGNYLITNVKVGKYKATCFSFGYGEATKKIEVKVNETVEFNFELVSQIAEVSGIVTDAKTGKPIPYATISLYTEHTVLPIDPIILKTKKKVKDAVIPLPDFILAITDEKGKYSFSYIAGLRTLVCKKSGYLEEKKEVQLNIGQNIVDFKLYPREEKKVKVYVYGYVTEADRKCVDSNRKCISPIEGARVTLYPLIWFCSDGIFCSKKDVDEGRTPLYTAITDQKGYYEIKDVLSDEYTAVVEKEGYEPAIENIIVHPQDTEINFQLRKLENIYGSIKGRVTQANVDCGKETDCIVPIKDVEIYVSPAEAEPILPELQKKKITILYDAITDENGYYSVENILAGKYIVYAYKEGYEKEYQYCEVSAGETTTVNLQLRLQNELSAFVSTDKWEYKLGEKVTMVLELTNNTGRKQSLTFPSSQQYDFVISTIDSSGNITEVWRWSKDKVFADVITQLTLEPWESIKFTETYTPEKEGVYYLVGIIPCRDPKTWKEKEIKSHPARFYVGEIYTPEKKTVRN